MVGIADGTGRRSVAQSVDRANRCTRGVGTMGSSTGTPPVSVHESLATRVLIGPGARDRDEVARLGVDRVLLVATRSAAAATVRVAEALGARLAARFDRPVVHTPVGVTAEAMALVTSAGVDGVVAIGGGSAIGLAKAVSSRTGVPQIAVPTTYAGSEVTPVLGETDNGVKTTRRDPARARQSGRAARPQPAPGGGMAGRALPGRHPHGPAPPAGTRARGSLRS